MKLNQGMIALVCTAFLLVGTGLGVQAIGNEKLFSFALPSDPMTFQAGEGSQIATTYCLICHSAEYIYMQPPHPREKWEEIVHKMKKTFGCPIPESDIPALLAYLISQNEIQTTVSLQKKKTGKPNGVTQAMTPTSGSADSGKKVFGTYCVNCHGQSGKGDGPIGKSLVPPAANLTLLNNKSDKEILKTIRKGRPGTAMPSWKNDLSSQEILDVLAYIRTLGS